MLIHDYLQWIYLSGCQQDENDCIIQQTNTHFKYGYEYLGNSGRLVITPLTDRSLLFTLSSQFYQNEPVSPKTTGFSQNTVLAAQAERFELRIT